MKKLVSYTVNKTIIDDFDKLATAKAINKSALIELFLKEWIKQNTDEKTNTRRIYSKS